MMQTLRKACAPVVLTLGILASAPGSNAAEPVKPEVAKARTFDSTTPIAVYQMIEGRPAKLLGMTGVSGKRSVNIPAGAIWYISPLGTQPKAPPGGGFGVGGGIGVGGGFGGGAGAFGFQGGPAPINPFGPAPNMRQDMPAPTKPTEKELKALVVEMKKQAVPGLALERFAYNDADLAHFKDVPGLRLLLLRGAAITNDGVRSLKTWPALRMLALDSDLFTGAGLADLKDLTWLEIRGKRFTDATIEELKPIKGLKTLRIKHTDIGESGLKALAAFGDLGSQGGLETLVLAGPSIPDAALPHLKTLGALRSLRLSMTLVSDEGLVNLKDLTALRVLFIESSDDEGAHTTIRGSKPREVLFKKNADAEAGIVSRITDAGFKHLSGLKELTELGVASEQISDDGVKELARMTNLKRLRLESKAITDKALLNLKDLAELETLELFEASLTTGEGIDTLKGLEKLRLFYMPSDTNKAMAMKYFQAMQKTKAKTYTGRPWESAPPANPNPAVQPAVPGIGGVGGIGGK